MIFDNKKLKKKWQAELDAALPELRSEIMEEPVPQKEAEHLVSKPKFRLPPILKRPAVLAGALAAVMLIIAIFPIMNALFPKEEKSGTVITVEVNPAATFVCDSDGKVISVHSANADADVILSSSEFIDGVIGADADTAVKSFVDMTVRLGYFDVNGDAVKLSSYGNSANEELLINVKSELSSYLKNEGILAVVLDEMLSEETFLKLNGVDSSSEKDFLNTISALSVLYTEREISDLTPDQIREQYEKLVICDEVRNLVEAELYQSIDKIVSRAMLLLEMANINVKIIVHSDNPSFLGNYWSVYDREDNSAELSELINEMKAKLDAYEVLSGKYISSYEEFEAELSAYSSLPFNDLNGFLALSDEDFIQNLDYILSLLKDNGSDADGIISMLDIPDNAEEFVTKNGALLLSEYSKREEENRSVYETDREEITDTRYNDFLNEISETYGSIDEYWKKISEK